MNPDVKKLTDFSGVIKFMDKYKPYAHLKKNGRNYDLKALIKIPKGKKHIVGTSIVHRTCERAKFIEVDTKNDASVTSDYVISIKVEFGPRFHEKIPMVGIKVTGDGTPEEGEVMIGIDDADQI